MLSKEHSYESRWSASKLTLLGIDYLRLGLQFQGTEFSVPGTHVGLRQVLGLLINNSHCPFRPLILARTSLVLCELWICYKLVPMVWLHIYLRLRIAGFWYQRVVPQTLEIAYSTSPLAHRQAVYQPHFCQQLSSPLSFSKQTRRCGVEVVSSTKNSLCRELRYKNSW